MFRHKVCVLRLVVLAIYNFYGKFLCEHRERQKDKKQGAKRFLHRLISLL